MILKTLEGCVKRQKIDIDLNSVQYCLVRLTYMYEDTAHDEQYIISAFPNNSVIDSILDFY